MKCVQGAGQIGEGGLRGGFGPGGVPVGNIVCREVGAMKCVCGSCRWMPLESGGSDCLVCSKCGRRARVLVAVADLCWVGPRRIGVTPGH
jgi:hypothetical protein